MSDLNLRIGDICSSIYSGGTPRSTNPQYYNPGTIPWLNSGEIHFSRISDTEKFISEKGLADSSAKWVQPPAVAIAMYGATAGNAAIIEKKLTTNQAICNLIVDSDKADYRYVYYSFMWLNSSLVALTNGAAQQNLNAKTIANFCIPHRSLIEQKKVSQILSCLDNKIELNRRLNDNLESMAQAIYDYWFVQFDFPKENGKPYKSSGGKMVWNEELKKEIPQGWKVKRLQEVVDTCLGGTPDTKNVAYWKKGSIPWVSSGDLVSNPLLKVTGYITQAGLDNSAAKLMPRGTVVVSLVRYIRPSILGIAAAGNQSVVGLFASEGFPTCFLYPYLKREVPRLMSMRTGAQQPHINKTVIDSSWILYPQDRSIIKTYVSRVAPMYEKLLNVAKDTELLIQQRDSLLPLLMNGQVQVV